MTKNLTLQSDPAGIEINVNNTTKKEAKWYVTNKVITVDDNDVLELTAPNTVGETQTTPEWALRFVQWKDNGVVIGTDRKISVTMDADKTRKAYYEEQEYFPTRNPYRRADKFEAKVDDDVYGLRTSALKSMMVEQQEVTTAQQTRIEELVGDYLNAQDLYGTDIHHYRNYSMELWGLTRLFKGTALNKEAQLKKDKWTTRGLTEAHLTAIAKLLGITVT